MNMCTKVQVPTDTRCVEFPGAGAVMSFLVCVLAIELPSSGRAVYVLNCGIISRTCPMSAVLTVNIHCIEFSTLSL